MQHNTTMQHSQLGFRWFRRPTYRGQRSTCRLASSMNSSTRWFASLVTYARTPTGRPSESSAKETLAHARWRTTNQRTTDHYGQCVAVAALRNQRICIRRESTLRPPLCYRAVASRSRSAAAAQRHRTQIQQFETHRSANAGLCTGPTPGSRAKAHAYLPHHFGERPQRTNVAGDRRPCVRRLMRPVGGRRRRGCAGGSGVDHSLRGLIVALPARADDL